MRFDSLLRRLAGVWSGSNATAAPISDQQLVALIQEADPVAAISDTREDRVIAAVLQALPDLVVRPLPQHRDRLAGSRPAFTFTQAGLRFATLLVMAAVFGGAVGWYTAVAIDGHGSSALMALLTASVERPLGL